MLVYVEIVKLITMKGIMCWTKGLEMDREMWMKELEVGVQEKD